MKRMKAEQKRRFAAVVAIILIVAMILSAALPIFWASANAAQTNSDYTIGADIGFGGYAKIGSSIPVTVTVTNNSDKNFKGEVSLFALCGSKSYSDTAKYNQLAKAVEIAAGGSRTVSFTVPVRYIQKELTVQLIKGKNVAAEADFPLSVGSDDDCWVGILSDNPDSLTYLKPNYQSAVNGQIVDLTAVVGSSTVNMESIDVFVVNDYDLAALSDLQLQEILDTVSAGNVMLLGGGSRIGSAERLGIAKLTKADLPEAYGKYTEALPDIIPIPNTDENRGELHLSDLGANYDSYKIGNGYIISFNADFSNSGAISSDTVFSSVIYAAYDYAAGSDDYGRESLDTQLIGYTDRLPNLTDNTIKVIFGIIYLYIAFIPILYVVLKRKDKREASIKVIPAAAVGISILIYLVSFNTVYKKPIASVINYADLRNADSGIAELKTYMNIVSPGKGDIKIELEGSSEILEVSEDNYSAYNYYDNTVANTGDGKIISAKILSLDNGAEIELAGKTKWDSTYITLSDNYEMNGGLDGEISIDNISSKLTGKITNDSGCDFDEAVVVIASDQGICEVKKATDIKKGDSIDVSDFDIDALSLEPQNYYSFADVINPYASTYSRNKNLSESYRLEMEQDIVDGVCGEYDFYDSSNNGIISEIKVMVIGFSTDDIYGGGTSVNNKKIKASTINVFRDEFNVEINSAAAQAYMTEADSTVLPVVNSFENAEIEDNQLYVYNTEEYVELSFDNYDRKEFAISWDTDADITIYNNYYDEWIMFNNGSRYSGVDAYTDEYGFIRIKAQGFADNYVPLPVIAYFD